MPSYVMKKGAHKVFQLGRYLHNVFAVRLPYETISSNLNNQTKLFWRRARPFFKVKLIFLNGTDSVIDVAWTDFHVI